MNDSVGGRNIDFFDGCFLTSSLDHNLLAPVHGGLHNLISQSLDPIEIDAYRI